MMIQLSLISTTWVVAGRSGRVIMLRHKSVDTTNLHVMSVWTQAGCAQGMSRGCNVAFQGARKLQTLWMRSLLWNSGLSQTIPHRVFSSDSATPSVYSSESWLRRREWRSDVTSRH
ncbi:hypothetical protein L227DRAFT_303125 [Lentinus tigrinus ALCF2SS1-6]|uniref:Uncharacterized protein n=1 Tax=Lentinus tigrinus ALCF2SS1-6 TaxID=1328759 RepID=A0A5C2RX19_9APHY|nr:hypothetical protein L227DRAFT_303125 [Lentinus tigrinus ALCF2SS1-6]